MISDRNVDTRAERRTTEMVISGSINRLFYSTKLFKTFDLTAKLITLSVDFSSSVGVLNMTTKWGE